MFSWAGIWGRSGAPLGPVCSIWLLLDIVLDHNLHLSSNLFTVRRKVLTDRSWKHVWQTHLDKGLPGWTHKRTLVRDTADTLPLYEVASPWVPAFKREYFRGCQVRCEMSAVIVIMHVNICSRVSQCVCCGPRMGYRCARGPGPPPSHLGFERPCLST